MAEESRISAVSKDVREVLVIVCFGISVLVLVGIVVGALWFTIKYPTAVMPSHLKDWASMSIGFLAGQLFKWSSDKV